MRRHTLIMGASLLASSSAWAECQQSRMNWRYQNETDQVVLSGTRVGTCRLQWTLSGVATVEKVSLVARPQKGSVQTSTSGAVYSPGRNFDSQDNFSLRICGNNRAGGGCSTLNVSVELR
ncbi:MAG: hypothetical protein JWO15_3959 [Sphingomonadales bacterium]|nr:hypothetical protein [Sphingomonadales bacterium]